MLEISENFTEIRQKGEDYYKTIGEVYCPYFKEKVHFTAGGLEHLKFKRPRMARAQQDQYMRFKLLKYVPQVLGNSHTVQGIFETKEFEKVRSHGRSESILQEVIYYEFIAVTDKLRIKVIVKKIGKTPFIFWSIIPFWGTMQSTGKRKLHSGNTAED